MVISALPRATAGRGSVLLVLHPVSVRQLAAQDVTSTERRLTGAVGGGDVVMGITKLVEEFPERFRSSDLITFGDHERSGYLVEDVPC